MLYSLLSAPYRYLYERRTFYLATDSSLRRVIARSPQKEHDNLKAIGVSEILLNCDQQGSGYQYRVVYDEIRFEKIFAIASEPTDVQEYINEVF